jgi:nucleoside phosphorylase
MLILTKQSDEIELGMVSGSSSILICAATSWEAIPIARALGLASQSDSSFIGNLKRNRILLLKTGIGEVALKQTLDALPRDRRFSRVISSGFCGALKSELRSGDIVCQIGSLGVLSERLARQVATAQKKSVHFGTIAHSAEVLVSSALKKSLRESSGSLAVDMETAPLRDWAKEKFPEANFFGIRVVLDALEDRLPRGMPKNETLVAYIFYAFSHPMDWPAFAQIYFKQKKAARALAEFLNEFLEAE